MNLSKIKIVIGELIRKKTYLPLFLQGSPGIGKSTVVNELTTDDFEVIDLRISMMTPSDLLGKEPKETV